MSKLRDKKNRHDRFHKKAKAQGFRARAAFKLEHIDNKVGLFKSGQRVCDLGCSPGSWLQYAAGKVGSRGRLVGLDRTLIEINLPNVRVMAGDVNEVTADELLGDDFDAFDVVMSDMAPDTSGVRSLDQDRSEMLFERALYLAEQSLAEGGHFAGKLFQGRGFQDLVKHCRQRFERVKIVKPPASRQESIEQYVVGLGFRG